MATSPPHCTASRRWRSAAQSGGLGCGPAGAAAPIGGPPPGADGFVPPGETLGRTQEYLSRAPAAAPRCSVGCGWRRDSKCWLGSSRRSETSHPAELANLSMACDRGGLVHERSGWTSPTQPPPEGAGSLCGPLSGLTGPPHGDIPPLSSPPASCTAGSSTHRFHSL